MSEILMKKDLQEALAHGVMKYSANYNSLVFSETNRYMIQSFFFMKNMDISIVDNNFRFDIELDREIINNLGEENLKEIQQRNAENKFVGHILDEFEKNLKLKRNNFIMENIFQEEEKDIKNINISLKELQIFKEVKAIFKLNSQIKLKEKYNGKYLSLSAHQKEFKLDKTILKLFEVLMLENIFDILIISPYFKDQDGFEDENISGVTIYMGINKNKV